jgi:hypothetical protein
MGMWLKRSCTRVRRLAEKETMLARRDGSNMLLFDKGSPMI